MTDNILSFWREGALSNFDVLFDNAPIKLHSIDRNGVLLNVSTFWARSLGYSRQEMIGRPSSDFLTEDSKAYAAETALPIFVRDGIIEDVEYEFIKKDGSVMPVLMSAIAQKGAQGEFDHSIAVMFDISETKRAQSLLNQRYRMEAVGQLVGGVAHDFNNLLAVIQGNAELLEELKSGEDAKPMTSAIVHASQRAAELTQRLLAYSRKQPLRPEVIDTRKLVSDMSDVLQRMLGETIVVSVGSRNGAWSALADPGQVEAALLNLGINARDAMPHGGKLIIECANVTLDEDSNIDGSEITAGDYVVLSVSDHGVGMSEEVRKRAFEPFFTTKGVGKGSGLGLSMIYGFAQQSGGQATIYSEEGKGTTVKLYLPRAYSETESTVKPKDEAVPRGNGETILVIEDDPAVRNLAEMMLRNLGYNVICAEDANEARQIVIGRNEIGLVLSDVILPGGASGPEFAEELRAGYPKIKVIFMSGYPAEAAKKNGFLGSDSVLLNKPFRVAQLARAMKEALR